MVAGALSVQMIAQGLASKALLAMPGTKTPRGVRVTYIDMLVRSL